LSLKQKPIACLLTKLAQESIEIKNQLHKNLFIAHKNLLEHKSPWVKAIGT
jgi:hypothetical protein